MEANIRGIPTPGQFDVHPRAKRGVEWKEYLEDYQTYASATGINNSVRKRDLLLTIGGVELRRLARTLPVAPRGERQAAAAANGQPAVAFRAAEDEFTGLVRALNDYFLPHTNKEMNRDHFRQSRQSKQETTDQFYARLCALATGCEYQDQEGEIKTQLIQGIKSRKLREMALQKPNLSLDQLLERARAFEAVHHHLNDADGKAEKSESVNRVRGEKWFRQQHGNQQQPHQSKGRQQQHQYQNKQQHQNQNTRGPIDTSRFRGGRHQTSHQHNYQTDRRNRQHQHNDQSRAKMCNNCGGCFHPEGREACPAFNKICDACNKVGHFARVCITSQFLSPQQSNQPRKSYSQRQQPYQPSNRRIRFANAEQSGYDSDSEDDEQYPGFTYRLRLLDPRSIRNNNTVLKNERVIDLLLFGKQIPFLVDTGADRTIISYSTYQRIGSPPLRVTSRQILPYRSNEPIKLSGVFSSQLAVPGTDRVIKERFYVLSKGDDDVDILSRQACEELNCVRFSGEVYIRNIRLLSEEMVDGNLPKIGKMTGVKVKLYIDESVPPVAHPYHKSSSIHLIEREIKEVKTLEALGLIEDPTGPTPWVSNTTFSAKPGGGWRYCHDSREINKALKRQRHILFTLEEILVQVAGSRYFSVLDLNSAYHQIELDESSRYITVFNTPIGLKQWKVLFFGLKIASEAFHNALRNALRDLEGVLNAIDDILVYAPTKALHDFRLKKVRERLVLLNLTTKPGKEIICQESVKFWGVVLTGDGIQMDPDKVAAIKNCSRPEDIKALKSFLGMISYCSRFVKGQADLTAPLRSLSRRSDAEFQWSTECDTAFEALKHQLCSPVTLAYYNPAKPTELIVDASPVGLGAILSQTEHNDTRVIIAYASKALSPAEMNYSQVEREAFAVVWGCKKFRFYLLGCKFICRTDNKALTFIFNGTSTTLSTRLSKFVLSSQGFDMTVKYCPGEENAADYLSRHPESTSSSSNCSLTRSVIRHVRAVVVSRAPCLAPPDEIAAVTAEDTDLQLVIKALFTGKSYNIPKHLEAYQRVFNELSFSDDGILLRGNRICIPQQLQRRVVRLAHEGHQGTTRTKQLLRSSVWFPNMDKLVDDVIKCCMACQVSINSKSRTPLAMSPMPDGPWQHLSADFYSVSNEADLLVLLDQYSRFPVVVEVPSTAFRHVERELNNILSLFGIPAVMRTDNGPPFNGEDFAEYAARMGFMHQKIMPVWPEANGEVERFMRTLGKIIRTATAEGANWREQLHSFLRNYRATAHPATGQSPTLLLFNRQPNTRLPHLQQHDAEYKQRLAEYANRRRRVTEHGLQPGDLVYRRREEKLLNKKQTFFETEPYTVVSVKGSMITVRRKDQEVTRNSAFFKKVQQSAYCDIFEDDIGFEQVPDPPQNPAPHPAPAPIPAAGRAQRSRIPVPVRGDQPAPAVQQRREEMAPVNAAHQQAANNDVIPGHRYPTRQRQALANQRRGRR